MKNTIISLLLSTIFAARLHMSAEGSAASNAAFDDILDGTLDDIPDLPSFNAWPAGAYRVLLKDGFKQKLINEKPAFELKMENLEVLEISNAAEAEESPKIGDETSVAFGLDTDVGKGFFKEAIKPFVFGLGLTPDQPGATRAAVDSSKGLEVLVVMKRRKVTKDGEEKIYPTLVKIELL